MAAESNPSSQQHTGRTLGQRYALTEPLAQGGLCAVYRGEDRVLRRPIAVKAITTARAPAYREALRRTAMLAHPATIAVYDIIEQDGWLFQVQEYVPARPLSAYVTAGVPVERAVALAGQLTRALAYAHAQDIAHGDLTPAAVLVDRQATVRINNFALPPDDAYFADMRQRIAHAARAEGEPAMAEPPTSEAGTAADTWAAGALLWLLVTSLVGSDASETRAFRDDVPEPVRGVVRRCLFPGQAEPITSMEALALALESLAEQLRQTRPMSAPLTPPALRAAREALADMAEWPEDEPVMARSGRPWAQAPVGAGASVFEAPTDPQLSELGAEPLVGADLATTQPAAPFGDAPYPAYPASPAPPRFTLPSRPLAAGPLTAGPLGEPPGAIPPSVPRWDVPARDAAITADVEHERRGVGLTTVLIVGLLLFIVFFVVGFMTPSLFAH